MEKYYYATTSEDIFKTVEGKDCPLCECSVVPMFASRVCFKLHFESKHYRYAVEYMINGKKACILCCYKTCYVPKKNPNEAKGGHYHCPFCEKVIKRKSSFVRHLYSFDGKCIKTVEQRKAAALKELNDQMPLIYEVEKHEEIYNPGVQDFSQEAQDRAWKEVAVAIRENEDICRLKWQGVKAAYNECLTDVKDLNQNQQSELKKEKDEGQFVASSAVVCNTDSMHASIQSKEIDDAANALFSELLDQKCLNSDNLKADNATTVEVVECGSDVGSSCSRKRKKLDLNSDDQNADDAFLRSLLPDLKRMDHRQKNHFKRKVLELIDEVLYFTP